MKHAPRNIQVLLIIVVAQLGGCIYDTGTKTLICVASGLRCRQGQVCTTEGWCVLRDGCGDGVINENEECDDNNLINNDGCDNNCTFTRIHNGVITEGEECDDGNTLNNDDCVGDSQFASCGDGFQREISKNIEDREECDDGNVITEVCEYNAPFCTVCDSRCRFVNGEVSFCGDGKVRPEFEVCDDGNLQCGTCSPDCRTARSTPASGLIIFVPPASINNNETFSLSDGVNPRIVFQFAFGGSVPTGRMKIDLSNVSGSATAVRDVVRDKIAVLLQSSPNSLLMDIGTLPEHPSILFFRHKWPSEIGNKDIEEYVVDSEFKVIGMSGGVGGDCLRGAGCRSDADCLYNLCENQICK